MTLRLTALAAIAVGAGLLAPRPARADDELRYELRGSAATALMVSRDQTARLGFDRAGTEAAVEFGWYVRGPFHLSARLGGAMFFRPGEPTGGLVDAGVGLGLGGDLSRRLHLGLALHAGAGRTGGLVRPSVHAGAQIGLRLSRSFWLGPVLGYGRVFQKNGGRYSSDASYLSLGLVLGWSPRPAAPPPPRPPSPLDPEPLPPEEPVGIEPTFTPPGPELLTLIEQALPMERIEESHLFPPVLFEFDSTELIPCGEAALYDALDRIRELAADRRVLIEGHADGSGEEPYNDELSAQRATAVRDWLVAHGVDAARLVLRARGERQHMSGEADERGRQLNRRVMFRVIEDGPEEAP
jgi:outer membrane protein OmpA-like peptidoglycan-associated protein